MRISEKTPAVEIYNRAVHLYHLRLLAILFLIPVYVLTVKWGKFDINIWNMWIIYGVIFFEVFINCPYKVFYKDSRIGFHSLIASVLCDFWAETAVLYFVGNVDIFIYSSYYVISIVYCALNLPKNLTLRMATFASSLYVGIVSAARLGLLNQAISFGTNLSATQEIAIVIRHVAFLYLIAFFARSLASALVTKEERMEELVWELRETNEKVKYAYHLQTDYFARMSHEIRNPLNSILGFSQLILESPTEPVTEKQKDFLTRIEKSGKHLRDMINDVLDLSKLESKKMKLSLQEINLTKTIESVFDIFYEEALQKQVLLGFDEKPHEPIMISADELKVRQVLYNLLSNALKFTPAKGWIALSLKKEPLGASIVVEDSGPGVPTENQKSIFEPYHQDGRGAGQSAKGTGLGLAISKQFIEMHGGKIWVESEPGKHCRFIIKLPSKPPAPQDQDQLITATA